jgi:hypothetical protein
MSKQKEDLDVGLFSSRSLAKGDHQSSFTFTLTLAPISHSITYEGYLSLELPDLNRLSKDISYG